jgi:hypothetical protein
MRRVVEAVLALPASPADFRFRSGLGLRSLTLCWSCANRGATQWSAPADALEYDEAENKDRDSGDEFR